jgi:hypothetical protein
MKLFTDFIPVFVNDNLPLIIALIALFLSIYAINISYKSLKNFNKSEVDKNSEEKKEPEEKPVKLSNQQSEILDAIERQISKLDKLFSILAETLFIYQSDSRLFYKHSSDIDRLKNKIQELQEIKAGYEEHRSMVKNIDSDFDFNTLDISIAEIKRLPLHIEHDLIAEKKTLDDLKKYKAQARAASGPPGSD